MATYTDLMSQFRMCFGDADAWGTTMEAWFCVADELYSRDPALIPVHWRYSPGASSSRPFNMIWTEILESADNETLLKFGRLVDKYTHILRANGMDY